MNLDLTQGDIASLIKKLAIPSSIGFFFHTMYNVTDTYFAGLISTDALSALTLSFSIFFMMIALAGGMSEAATALVGNALGEKQKDRAVHIALNSLAFAFVLSFILSFIGILSTPFLISILGAEGEYLSLSLEYINIILYGSLFFVFSFFLNALLNAVGDTVSFRNILIFSSFLNIFLDYWFVLGGLGLEALGIKGISIATVLTEFLTALYLFYKLRKTPLLKGKFVFDIKVFKTLLYQGFPPSINMIMMASGIFIMTYFITPFGNEVVAAFGIGMRIEQIVLMPTIGLNVAVLAIVSQNYGAKNYERIRKTIKVSLFYGASLSFLGLVLLLLFAQDMMHFFTNDAKVIYEGVIYLRVEAFIIFSFVLIFVYLALLQGLQKPAFIFYISIFRQIVAPILLLSLFAYLGLGLLWIWLGIAVIVSLSALITWRYSIKKLKEVDNNVINNGYYSK